jgi:hypothetical protein
VTDELSKLDLVLSKLEDVRETDTGFRARCPVHGGRSPDDLSIALGKSWVVIHCFANCEPGAIVRAMGLEWRDLVLDSDEPRARARPVAQRERELTAMACALRLQNEPDVLKRLRFKRGWARRALELLSVGWDGSRLTLPVREADGKLHDTLRYDPFTKTGRKILAGKGKARHPWPAPESLPNGKCIVVEGEGCAISLLSIGLHAVALPGSLRLSTNVSRPGSWQGGGWHKTWAQRFTRFTHVILFPDLDGPGRALMGAVRYDLEKAGITTKLIDLGPKTWDGTDIADMMLGARVYDGPTRAFAKNQVREIVARGAELLVA